MDLLSVFIISVICIYILMLKATISQIKEGRIIPVFVTTTKFSNTARKFANSLNVLLMTVPLEDYPMIKCNINRNTGERIYHLPFDQQYDKCIINPAEGEFYAKTVKEAEENGFRRAMRWRGN